MSNGICVGIALTREPERAQVAAWLDAAGNRVVSLIEGCHVDMAIAGRGFGCILADAEMLTTGLLAALHREDSRLQVVAVIDSDRALSPELHHRSVRTLPRPIDEAALTLAICLAYGENRHLRRSPRWQAPRLGARAGGAAAEIVDVSADGVRLELSRVDGAKLTPEFRLRIPMLALDVVVRRVWVKGGAGGRVQCGAVLVALNATEQLAWERGLDFVRSSSSPANDRGGKATTANQDDGEGLIERISWGLGVAARFLGGQR